MFSKETKIKAVFELIQGIPQSKIMRKYGIKGSATLYEWHRRLKQFGPESLAEKQYKTYYDYSFKIKVINWRLINKASYPATAKRFKIKHPSIIWQWERALMEGRLQSKRKRYSDIRKEDKDKSKAELSEENRILRVRLAYLEKVQALMQKKPQSKTNKKHK